MAFAAIKLPRARKWILIGLGCLFIVGFGIIYFVKRPILAFAVDENNLPKIVQANFVDLSAIGSISQFRSNQGHDFSGHGETCRSMKHYFTPIQSAEAAPTSGQTYQGKAVPAPPTPETAIPIYSPVDGSIDSISAENFPVGEQFSIRPDSHPTYDFRLFHVFPAPGIHSLMHVKAGQQIGEISKFSDTDISVELTTLKGTQFVSYFQVMPDSIFSAYQARGAQTRDDFILTKAYRDAHPLECNGENFAQKYQGDPSQSEEVHLSGYVAPIQQGQQNSQSTEKNGQQQDSSQSVQQPTTQDTNATSSQPRVQSNSSSSSQTNSSACSTTIPADQLPPGCKSQ